MKSSDYTQYFFILQENEIIFWESEKKM